MDQAIGPAPRWNRLRLSSEYTFKLRDKKSRTGLTPNILIRLGFVLSLADEQIPNPETFDEGGLEFNRTTLVGDLDGPFELLLRQRLLDDGLDPVEDYLPQLRAHMNRGAQIICSRVRSISDIGALVPSFDTTQQPLWPTELDVEEDDRDDEA